MAGKGHVCVGGKTLFSKSKKFLFKYPKTPELLIDILNIQNYAIFYALQHQLQLQGNQKKVTLEYYSVKY